MENEMPKHFHYVFNSKLPQIILFLFYRALCNLKHYTFSGDELSPVKHIYIKDGALNVDEKEKYLRNITKYIMEKGVAMTVAVYLRDSEINCPEPSIRLASSRKLNDENISLICSLLDEAYENVGPKPEITPV